MSRLATDELQSSQEQLGSRIVLKPLNEGNDTDVTPIIIDPLDEIYSQIKRLKRSLIFGWAALFVKHPRPKWYAVDEGSGNVRFMLGDKEAFLREYESAHDARSGIGVIYAASGQGSKVVASPASNPPGNPLYAKEVIEHYGSCRREHF